MSEYQSYEFVALDRPLTPAEMAELRSISTRAQITPTRLFNEYQWGDLKADPAELLVRYFDVHVYFANWGSRRLMFRLPLHAVNLDDLRACVPGGPVTLTVTQRHVVLDLWSETEEPEEEWFEDGQLLASLTPLRAELLRGDRRVAYLAWLLAAQAGELDPDTPEPRVPHGLDAPSASLAALTSFLRVDPDLLAAAADAGVEDTGEMERFRSWVERLPAREQQRWLLRAADSLDLAVGSALLAEFRRAHPPLAADQGRTVAQLLDRAEERRAERLLGALDGWVLAVRCRRNESLRQARASSSARDPEVRRYRAAGASDAGRSTFPSARDSVEDFFISRLLTDVSNVVVIEGDSPLRDVDLRVFVAPPPAAGQTLLVRERRDRTAQQRARAAAMEWLLGEPDGAARLLEQLVGGLVVAFARERPELLEQARVGLLAGIGKIRTAPLLAPTEHWAVAVGYAGIESAQLVVVNACEDAERRRAHGLLEDVRRLRACPSPRSWPIWPMRGTPGRVGRWPG